MAALDSDIRNSSTGAEILKYKHLYGTPNKKADTYFNLTPAVNASMDSPLITASASHWAVPWAGGGGPVYVGRHGDFGKVQDPSTVPTLNGHKSPVLALGFSPFLLPGGGTLLATGADDQRVKVWTVPPAAADGGGGGGGGGGQGGLTESSTEATGSLSGHYYGVRALEFHPTATLLASAAGSSEVFFWDLETMQKCDQAKVGSALPESSSGGGGSLGGGAGGGGVSGSDHGISSLSFNHTGSLLAVATKGSSGKILDPRLSSAGEGGSRGSVVLEIDPLACGAVRAQRCLWLTNHGQSDSLLTVGGAAGGRGRVVSLWDSRNLKTATATKKVDVATGQLFPVYDEGTNTLLLSGRGDTTVRVFELGSCCDKLSHCSDVTLPGHPTLCGMAKLPTQCLDIGGVETCRLLRLTQSSVDPLSFVLPRSEKLKEWFQDDVYRDARAFTPVLTPIEWLEGSTANDDQVSLPSRVSLQPKGLPALSTKPPEVKRQSSADMKREEIKAAEAEKESAEAMMVKLQGMAKQRASYHPNNSMGSMKGVDAQPIYDSDDGGWSDEDE